MGTGNSNDTSGHQHMNSICKVCSGQQQGNKWLPLSINDYRKEILSRYSGEVVDFSHQLHPVFSNIAYNLQYLEYLNKCFEDLYITSVLRAQNVKMFVLTSSQIIECFLYVKLVQMGVHKDDIWEFSRSLRLAQEKNAFGLGAGFYKTELNWLKDMRNHIHIQSPAKINEADYAVFENIEVLNRSKQLLLTFLQKVLKMPTAEAKDNFYFLQATEGFVHSITPEVAE
jgi:hypothetical protein